MTQIDWSYWQAVMRGLAPAVVETEPQAGFYEDKAPDGTRRACAIWPGPDGRMIGRYAVLGPFDPYARWTWVCSRAIPKSYYDAVEQGRGWPDEPEPVPMERRINLPSDPAEAIAAELEGEESEFDAWLSRIGGAIKDEDAARLAAHWQDRIDEIAKRAEAKRNELRKPHLEAAAAVQEVWKPLVDRGTGLVKRIKAILTPYLLEKQRQAAEEAAAAAAAGEAASVRNASVGATGRKVALRTEVHAEIEDYKKALAFFADNGEVRDLIQKLANRAVKAGVSVPGVRRVATQKAA